MDYVLFERDLDQDNGEICGNLDGLNSHIHLTYSPCILLSSPMIPIVVSALDSTDYRKGKCDAAAWNQSGEEYSITRWGKALETLSESDFS